MIDSAGPAIWSHSARRSTSAIRASPLTTAARSESVPRTGTVASRSATDSWDTFSSPSAGSTCRM